MIVKRKFSEIRNIKFKLLYGSIIVLVLFFSVDFATSTLKLNTYRNESKPFTDEFLNLLMENEYERIFGTYSNKYSGDFESFKKEIDKLCNEFGNIISYEYKRTSASTDGIFGDLLGFTIYYNIKFDNDDTYTGKFSIEVDKETNRPMAGKIMNFNISGDYGRKFFTMRF